MKNDKGSKALIEIILFPETFADAVDLLLEYIPFLRIKCMHDLLIKKAAFFTFYAVSTSIDADWDIKEQAGEDVSMNTSFEEDLLNSNEKDLAEEVRKYTNYTYLDALVKNYALGLATPRRRLNLPYRK